MSKSVRFASKSQYKLIGVVASAFLVTLIISTVGFVTSINHLGYMATDNRMDEEYRILQQRLADAEAELLGMALFLAQQSGLAEAITRNDTTFIQRTIDNTVLRFHPRAVIITAPGLNALQWAWSK